MTEPLNPDIQAAIEIGALFASRWERREMEPVLKEEVAEIIRKHNLAPSATVREAAQKPAAYLTIGPDGHEQVMLAQYLTADLDRELSESEFTVHPLYLALPVPSPTNGEPVAWYSHEHDAVIMDRTREDSSNLRKQQYCVPLYSSPPAASSIEAEAIAAELYPPLSGETDASPAVLDERKRAISIILKHRTSEPGDDEKIMEIAIEVTDKIFREADKYLLKGHNRFQEWCRDLIAQSFTGFKRG